MPAVAACAESFAASPGPGLFPEEEALVARATEKRRREFAAGRGCAREALAALGLGKAPILRGYRGAPQWPPGVVGSITHCAGYCASAVAHATDLAAIGVDAEPNVALPGGVLEMVTQPAERARLRDLAAAKPDISWDCLLFCAKEAVYKAWFPLTGRWLGFADADVTINAADATFTARLLVPVPDLAGPSLAGGFSGRWLSRDNLIVTAIAVAALEPVDGASVDADRCHGLYQQALNVSSPLTARADTQRHSERLVASLGPRHCAGGDAQVKQATVLHDPHWLSGGRRLDGTPASRCQPLHER